MKVKLVVQPVQEVEEKAPLIQRAIETRPHVYVALRATLKV